MSVFVRGSGGALFEMDVPPEGTNQRELFDYKLETGELVIVENAVWEDFQGAKVLRVAPAADGDVEEPAKPKRGRKAAEATDAEEG